MKKIILHSDLNNFYASVECMLNPELRDKFVAVCGNREDRHGIVLAKNIAAKGCGVKTGETIWEAKLKCPELVVVPPTYDEYIKYSRLTKAIYYDYTNLVEPFGMDECWLDVTGSTSLFGTGAEIAEKIRKRIKKEIGLTVSIGVSFNKIFAKLGSDMKKPDAVTEISHDSFREKIWSLPAEELLGVGRATIKRLHKYNILTIGDLANTDINYLKAWFGKHGENIYNYANGFECQRVASSDYQAPIKSMGHGITCTTDLYTEEEVFRVIFELTQNISHRLRLYSLKASGVSLCVRDKSLSFREFQCQLPVSTMSSKEISSAAFTLFLNNYNREIPVRALTVRAINLSAASLPCQTTLFTDITKHEKNEKIECAIDKIRNRYGKTSITFASLIGDLKMPETRNSEIIMPSPMFV